MGMSDDDSAKADTAALDAAKCASVRRFLNEHVSPLSTTPSTTPSTAKFFPDLALLHRLGVNRHNQKKTEKINDWQLAMDFDERKERPRRLKIEEVARSRNTQETNFVMTHFNSGSRASMSAYQKNMLQLTTQHLAANQTPALARRPAVVKFISASHRDGAMAGCNVCALQLPNVGLPGPPQGPKVVVAGRHTRCDFAEVRPAIEVAKRWAACESGCKSCLMDHLGYGGDMDTVLEGKRSPLKLANHMQCTPNCPYRLYLQSLIEGDDAGPVQVQVAPPPAAGHVVAGSKAPSVEDAPPETGDDAVLRPPDEPALGATERLVAAGGGNDFQRSIVQHDTDRGLAVALEEGDQANHDLGMSHELDLPGADPLPQPHAALNNETLVDTPHPPTHLLDQFFGSGATAALRVSRSTTGANFSLVHAIDQCCRAPAPLPALSGNIFDFDLVREYCVNDPEYLATTDLRVTQLNLEDPYENMFNLNNGMYLDIGSQFRGCPDRFLYAVALRHGEASTYYQGRDEEKAAWHARMAQAYSEAGEEAPSAWL